MMGCNRNRNINRNGQVMGEFGTPRIALRGPGCINGTGRCNVAGARGRCTNVFGTGDDFVNRYDNDVMGTGGRRDHCNDYDDDVMGTGGRRRRCNYYDDDVMGTGGRRRRCDDVAGTGGRRNKNWNCCDWIWSYLETPITVPR
jgi:hypothetical protein